MGIKMRLAMLLFLSATLGKTQANEPLKLEKTIQLPDVQGRIDHMSLDVKGQRLFVSALGNNTVEVIDLKAGKRANTISGLKEPQGVLFVADNGRLFVASSKDGTVKMFDGDRKSTRLNSSHTVISYAVFCLKKKNKIQSYAGTL